MFEEYCPVHQARVLLSPGRIVAIDNTADGIVVTWRCWCGHEGRSDRRHPATGRPAAPVAPARPAGPTGADHQPTQPAPLSQAC